MKTMQARKQSDQVHESEIDEGFVPIRNIIHQNLQINLKKQEKRIYKKKQFVPRYILQGIIRKQPSQCYSRFGKFDFIQEQTLQTNQLDKLVEENKYNQSEKKENICIQTITNKQKGLQKQKILTPFDKFIASGNYILVYSRYKDFEFNNLQPNFASNFVRLDCLRSSEETKYKAIKSFQIVDERKQQILFQNMTRNGSLREAILQFDSKFESGNLLCAFKHKKDPYTYTLFIHNDTNTNGYNHWFYFSIKNAQVGVKYHFHIVNFRKRHSFFKQGNKPVVFSFLDSQKEGKSGYSKRGQNISYSKSGIIKSYQSKEKFFQLSFSLKFWNENDVYYISTGLPYSYSKLLNNLSLYEELARQNRFGWSLQSIGTSIGGNSIPYVTINKFQDHRSEDNTSTSKSYRQSQQKDIQEIEQAKKRTKNDTKKMKNQTKKIIFIAARQHPGETWSSYLADEFIHSIVTQSTPESKYLLDNFIIKCIPMINVDGVISGNFRCDLSGMDLNRNWKTPSPLLHPQIFSIKNQILNLTEKGYQIQTYFDLHGHSKQYNLFCYSCKTDNYQCRILPYLLSQYYEGFYFPFCTFGISKYKQTTARAIVFGIIKNPNVLTIEASLFGTKIDGKIKVFEPQSMKQMAQTMIKGCKSYFSHDQKYISVKEIIKEKISQFLSYKGQNGNQLQSGSDSQPEGDQIDINEKLQKMLPKNLISQYPQLEEMNKSVKKPRKKVKKEKTQNTEQKKPNKKEESFGINEIRTVASVQSKNIQKATKSEWIFRAKKSQPSQGYSTSGFKNRSFIMSNKTINQQEFLHSSKQLYRDLLNRQDHKLSFFPREKNGLVPMRMRNQSLQIFKDAYNATQKHIKTRYEHSFEQVKDQKRYTNRKIAFYKDNKKTDKQEFPVLCVMSQNRKKRQIQIMQGRNQESKSQSLGNGTNIASKLKTAIQVKSQGIKQLKQRNKKNIDLLSRIWKDNITRFGMGYSAFRIYD